MAGINFSKIEKKWQDRWEKQKIFEVKKGGKRKKYYVLEMFPYPSGSGLHMGHALNYTIGDIFSRFKRMNGFNVLYPMGYDSLGLPAENAAIKAGEHPSKYTNKSIARFISAADQISGASPTTIQEARDFILKVLDSLHHKTPTMWQIIYDPLLSRVYFRTRDKKGLKHVDLKNIDFQCHNPMLVLNINETGQGDVSHKIKPYHRDINRDLIKNALLKTPFIKKAPKQVLDHRSM